MGATIDISKYVYFLPVVILQAHVSNSALYTTYSIEADRTCTINGLQPRVLKVSSKSGAIVEENSYFDRHSLSGKYPYKCSFIVDANSNLGIIAVIQEMKLRRDEDTHECIDYVQFRHSNYITVPFVDISVQHKEERPWGAKICGKVDAKKPDISSFNIADATKEKMLPSAFVDREGKIDVRIYVANVTRSADTELDLKIAFTAYQPCSDVSSPLYKKCSTPICIWHEYFNDGILNCPYTTCADEGGCQLYVEAGFRHGTGLATKIMVGAVAGIFTMFIVFVLFLWVFRHCAICWNSPTTSAQNTTQMRPVPTAEEIQPTAPPGSPSIDKDLPPSYESLFPNP
ncbi:hypothetical protein V9T40_008131 [Parthenolecanium corni]|uniref:Uncharacterized protein n=1 Tax=Parthenolecanium corni TaxID=536013 RepID=A0AAN9TPL3_9HEMI